MYVYIFICVCVCVSRKHITNEHFESGVNSHCERNINLKEK